MDFKLPGPPQLTMKGVKYLQQLHHAEAEMRNYYKKIESEGWLWNDLGFYYHPDKPGQEIWPG